MTEAPIPAGDTPVAKARLGQSSPFYLLLCWIALLAILHTWAYASDWPADFSLREPVTEGATGTAFTSPETPSDEWNPNRPTFFQDELPSLELVAVDGVVEASESHPGTVIRLILWRHGTTRELPVRFSVDSPGEFEIPSEVIIAAGQSSICFPISNLDDSFVDGRRSVVLIAHAADHQPAHLILWNEDNEVGRLVLELPDLAFERYQHRPGTGQVRIHSPQPFDLKVHLSADVPLKVPAVVRIPAGAVETSFPIEFGDDLSVTQPGQRRRIQAGAHGWIEAEETLRIFDLAGNPVDEVVLDRVNSAETRVEVISSRRSDQGSWISETNGYVQLAAGQNYWDTVRQSWEPTVEEITLAEVGAHAVRGTQKATFAPTLDDPFGTIGLETSDGQRLRSTVLALCYFDPVTGQRATVGLVRDAPGELLPPNQVMYRNAFEPAKPPIELAVDVIYTYRKSGTEQDVVLRAPPPPPEEFGFSTQFARLEVLTEFYEAPDPARIVHLLGTVDDPVLRAQMAAPDWFDEHLDFGSFLIGEGRAFRLGSGPFNPPDGEGTVVVGKQWIEEGERRVLSESVEYRELAALLEELPMAGPATPRPKVAGGWADSAVDVPRAGRPGATRPPREAGINAALSGLPPRPPPVRGGAARRVMTLAQSGLAEPPGVIIDYLPRLTDLSDYTFQGGQTYHVTDVVNLRGTTTIEGGTVVKFDPCSQGDRTPQLVIVGSLACATSLYRPAVFTARDDPSVGQPIVDSSVAPHGGQSYGDGALWFQTDPSEAFIEHVRFRYSRHGVFFTQRSGTVRDAQFQHCEFPVGGDRANRVQLLNALAVDMGPGGAPFKPIQNSIMTGEHVTVCNSPNLRHEDSRATLTLRNCILSAIATPQSSFVDGGGNTFSYATDAGLFERVGAGHYYLAAQSADRDTGVDSIDPGLAAQLRDRTTHPPVVLTASLPAGAILQPVADVRDTGALDRGYHYPPLDYCLSNLQLTQDTLTLSQGVAVGVFGSRGILLGENARLVGQGSPFQLNRLVRFDTVQEQVHAWGDTSGNHFCLLEIDLPTGGLAPEVDFFFTEFSHLASPSQHATGPFLLAAGGANQRLNRLALTHCLVRGLELHLNHTGAEDPTIGLTNNLFETCATTLRGAPGGGRAHLSAFHNLFRGGSIAFDNQDFGSVWNVRDNLFDCDTPSAGSYVSAAHNGFRRGLIGFGSPRTTDLIPDYQRGPLGPYYYPTSGGPGSLVHLINAGSRSASQAGLWHYTTSIDLKKEAHTVVDIGFHYLTTDTAGIPPDADADGIPDYALDPSGRGLGDSDYDGITDAEELSAGQDPADPSSTVRRRLSHWRFNSPQFTNEAGFAPIQLYGLSPSTSWSGSSLFNSAPYQFLRYNTIESDGSANINLRQGTVRMWFKPNWTSQNLGGNGLGHHSALLQVGPNVEGLTWVLSLWDHGNQFDLVSRQRLPNGGTVRLTAVQVPISWSTDRWYQIVVAYSATNLAAYINGQLASHGHWTDLRPVVESTGERLQVGEGMRFYPDLSIRNDGIRVGHRFNSDFPSVALPCNGWIDELETFNYPLSAAEVARGFHNLPSDTVPKPKLDTDYDGRSDFLETHVDGTDPQDALRVTPCRLGYWRFNDAAFLGDRGQEPLDSSLRKTTARWSADAASLSTGFVAYREVEANGLPNFNAAAGGVRFWFKPNWSSGSGPSEAPLLWMGDPDHLDLGFWALRIDASGLLLRLVTSSNLVTVINLSAPVNLVAHRWYQVALNYSSTGSTLRVNDGTTVAGLGVTRWPNDAARALGWCLGNDPTGTRSVQGAIDELETRNAPFPNGEILASFRALKTVDTDLNGVLDVAEELTVAQPFLGEPFAVTGAIEAEQYDQGGNGSGYGAVGSTVYTNYRPGRLVITETTDALPDGSGGDEALGGYDVCLKAGEWTRYSLDVRVAGTYAIEARVSGHGAAGGLFQLDVALPGGGAYATTGPLIVSSADWSVVGRRMVSLLAGNQELTLTGLANAPGQSDVGRFNYLTIYPSWNEGVDAIQANQVLVTGMIANDDSWRAATNNRARIQGAISSLTTSPTAGGRVRLPAGSFYLAQPAPSDTAESEANTSVFIGKSYLEIQGAGRTETELIAHNRATTLLYLGRSDRDTRQAVTNVVLRDLTLAGRPHRIAVGDGGGGFTTVTEAGWLAVDLNFKTTGALVMCDGDFVSSSVGILVTQCVFRNPSDITWMMRGSGYWVSNLVFRSNEFQDRVPPDGFLHNPTQVTLESVTTANRPSGSAHLWGRFRSARNVVVVSNSFNGNVGITGGPDYTDYNGGDGILWLQGGGNYYAADNVITNYYLEGMQVNGGPAAMVRNRFVTFFSTGSCTAFNTFGSRPGASGAIKEDIVFSVLGNSISGGRNANLGVLATITDANQYRLDLAGNRASLESLSTARTGPIGAFSGTQTNRFLNITGNRLEQGGHALTLGYCGGVAWVLHNDFSGVEYRGVLDDSISAEWHAGAVVGNVINRGLNDHFRGRLDGAPKWFFHGNVCTDGSSTIDLQVNHASFPVHCSP